MKKEDLLELPPAAFTMIVKTSDENFLSSKAFSLDSKAEMQWVLDFQEAMRGFGLENYMDFYIEGENRHLVLMIEPPVKNSV